MKECKHCGSAKHESSQCKEMLKKSWVPESSEADDDDISEAEAKNMLKMIREFERMAMKLK